MQSIPSRLLLSTLVLEALSSLVNSTRVSFFLESWPWMWYWKDFSGSPDMRDAVVLFGVETTMLAGSANERCLAAALVGGWMYGEG